MNTEIKKFYNTTKFDFSKRNTLSPDFEWPENWIRIFFKTYPRFKKIDMDFSELNSNILLKSFLENRRSTRNFNGDPIYYQDLCDILKYSMGIKNHNVDIDETKRFYPSAGGRYPIESYIIVNNVLNLNNGLYHYNIKRENLEVLLEEDTLHPSDEIFGLDNYEGKPNFLILTSVISRTEVKYMNNAYRFSCIECGHIGQNFSLISQFKNIGSCAIGGFDNDKLAKLLDVTEDEIPLYAFAFGNSK